MKYQDKMIERKNKENQMKAAIEDKQNNIGFYIFNRRYKNKFIKKVKREVKNLRSIWTYDDVENGVFTNTKDIYKNKTKGEKMSKDIILQAMQKKTPLTYETVEQVYKIIKSYDAVMELNQIALKYNKDIVALARFLAD